MMPWEKYQASDTQEGPWNKYATAELAETKVDDIKPVTQKRTPVQNLGRQAGLVARSLIKGAIDTADFVTTPVRESLNLIPGVNIPAGALQQSVPEALGLPTPEGRAENFLAKGAEMAGGAGAFMKGAQIVGNTLPAAAVKAKDVLSLLSAKPGVQLTSAASSGVAGEFVKQEGGTPGQQLAASVAGGLLVPSSLRGAASIISPKASTNPQLQALRAEGVTPTIGQALGGRAAIAEEKLQSVPILGDMIHRARGQTLESFNKAAINRALAPVGKQTDKVGHEAIKEAGDVLSKTYNAALSQVKNVKFDAKFDADSMQLRQMANGLSSAMRNKFNHVFTENVVRKMGPQRSMLGESYKAIDSEIGGMASRYGKSSVASEQELGDALSQLQNLLKQQMMRSNPGVAEKLKAADTGWANLVRIEGAAKAAKNAEGIFTPAQLNAAIQLADKSVRGRAVARGTALMQDLGGAGQKTLGSKYPDSGTAGRLALGGAAVGAGAINPAIPASLALGGSMYTRPIQNALVRLLADRPEAAHLLARQLRAPTGNALARSPAWMLPAAASVSE